MNTRFQKHKSIVFILVAVLMVTFGTNSISYAQQATPTITTSVEEALTETNIDGKEVTITLTNGTFERNTFTIRNAVSVSGIAGVTKPVSSPDRESDTELTLELEYDYTDFDETSTLTITVGSDAIVDYDGDALTAQLTVTAVEESMTATTEEPLTESTLNGSTVTLTLSGRTFIHLEFSIGRAISISGIDGVTIATFDVDRVSPTQVKIKLSFSGNIDSDSTLTITVGADAIENYSEGFTFELAVTAVVESMTATTEAPLTEATLHGSSVTLTLSGATFVSWDTNIEKALTITGIDGVSIARFGVERINDTKVTLTLLFSGNIDADSTLTLIVGADATNRYNQPLTAQLPVTAVEESMTATVATPLTEATLSGNIITLKLTGRNFISWQSDISEAITLTGIEGVSVALWDVERVSNREVTLELSYSNNFDTDSTLTLTVGADAIAGYNQDFTFNYEVPAVAESMEVSTDTPLTEANLGGYGMTFTLTGRSFADVFTIRDALFVTGIDGVSISRYGVERVSNTELSVILTYTGNIDTDSTLTFEISADAINGYNQDFTFEFNVPAVEERLEVSTEEPLTEATLHGGSIQLKVIGRVYTRWLREIEDAVTLSGIDGLTVGRISFGSEDGSVVAIPLEFEGDIDTDAQLTITVAAGSITGFTEAFTAQIPVTAVEESLEIDSGFALNEATLNGSIITLKLNGRNFDDSIFDIADYITFDGIEGVSINFYFDDTYDYFYESPLVFDNRIQINLGYDGTDFDTDQTLTITVGADAIAGYGEPLTVQIPVTAIKQSAATISISPDTITSAPLGEQMTIDIDIAGGVNVAGFQAKVNYNTSTLSYEKMTGGDYLPADALYVDPVGKAIAETKEFVDSFYFENLPEDNVFRQLFLEEINEELIEVFFADFNLLDSLFIGQVPFAAVAPNGVSNGNGTLATLTFDVVDVAYSSITLSDVYIVDRDGVRWEVEVNGSIVEEPQHDIVGDINRDGIVNIQDLILVSNLFGRRGEHRADVNNDGVIDIADLVIVANAFGTGAAAPALNADVLDMLSAADVKEWLAQAKQLDMAHPQYRGGVNVLKHILNVLTPKKTALLPNFPNPFNPETWIPYHLSKDAEVTLSIYAFNGTLVRTLDIGYQSAGRYENRSRAAYWDGTNQFGEKVASGIYFFTLTAGEYTATRKMLIRK